VDRLEKLFKSDSNQLFAGSTFAHCPRCKTLYAVFLPSIDDKKNLEYVFDLEKRIAEDCNNGKHALPEIQLDVTP